MQVFCPRCREIIRFAPDREVIYCSKCDYRYRVYAGKLLGLRGQRQNGSWRYTVSLENSAGASISFSMRIEEELSFAPNSSLAFLFRGSRCLGIGDQKESLWFPLRAASTAHPLLLRWALYMTWPLSLLVLLQTFRLGEAALDTALASPASFLLGLGATALLLLMPIVLLGLEKVFPSKRSELPQVPHDF